MQLCRHSILEHSALNRHKSFVFRCESRSAFEDADAVEAVGVFRELLALDQFIPDFLTEFAWGDDGLDAAVAPLGERAAAEAGFFIEAREFEAAFECLERVFEFFVSDHEMTLADNRIVFRTTAVIYRGMIERGMP